jgi:hypothetical protein
MQEDPARLRQPGLFSSPDPKQDGIRNWNLDPFQTFPRLDPDNSR